MVGVVCWARAGRSVAVKSVGVEDVRQRLGPGRSSQPARSVQHEPRPKIALQTPFAALILVEGKPNGECRIKSLGSTIEPGSSAVFLLVRKAVEDKIMPRLSHYEAKVLKTSLSNEQEERLKAALSKAA